MNAISPFAPDNSASLEAIYLTVGGDVCAPLPATGVIAFDAPPLRQDMRGKITFEFFDESQAMIGRLGYFLQGRHAGRASGEVEVPSAVKHASHYRATIGVWGEDLLSV